MINNTTTPKGTECTIDLITAILGFPCKFFVVIINKCNDVKVASEFQSNITSKKHVEVLMMINSTNFAKTFAVFPAFNFVYLFFESRLTLFSRNYQIRL